MKVKHKFLILLAILALLAIPTAVFAQGSDGDGQVVFGGSYTLASGETLAGNLVVLGGSAEVEEAAVVEGDLLQYGGSMTLAGEVLGSLFVAGGTMDIADTAVVHGDFSRLGGAIDIAPGAEMMGNEIRMDQITEGFPFEFIFGDPGSIDSGPAFGDFSFGDLGRFEFSESFGPGRFFPEFTARGFVESDYGRYDGGIFGPGSPLQEFLWLLLRSFFYAVLAVLIVLFLEKPAQHVRRAAVVQPWLAGGIGLLAMVLAVPVLIMVTITIILIPVSFSLLVVLLALGTFGWIAVGMEVGNRLSHMFKRDWHPALAAGIGVLTLSLAKAALWQIPCIGFIAFVLVAAIGLGSVFLTRFGTREYELESSDLPAEVE
ncbi:MAG: hypothetical protein R3335_08425 [Anaerolineales bacterium]|nr:hypothetical protein [Anaerolineales bacterium]